MTNKLGIRQAFWTQKGFAQRHRKIPFLFTFDEWVKWWEDNLGPNWYQLRGSSAGQYVMARKGDKGPYAPGNVICITCHENARTQVANGTSSRGERSGVTKLKEHQVKDIFYASEQPADIAAKYGISIETVRQIKRRATWRYLTRTL